MRKGYTLVELLVCIALLAIMVTIAVPVISSISNKSGNTADEITAQSIETAIDSWMQTEYEEDNFYRTNLFTSASTGEATASRIGGYTEQMYSYNFAGTGQLPGTELTDETQIRHSVITAIKATSGMKIDIRNGEQFIEGPQSGAQFGFKYYYKLGRVSVERTDSNTSIFGNDEVYRYYVWLDQRGGVIDTTTMPKSYRGTEYLYVASEELCSIVFDYAGHRMGDVRVVVEQEGMMSHTFEAVDETPRMFKPGVYTVKFYLNGDLYSTVANIEITLSGQEVVMQ